MLRIVTTETEDGQKWVLHGQLAGPWAAEMRAAWEQSRRHDRKSVVDLTDVTFVDETGALVLCDMKSAGVRFIASGVDTKHLLDDLKRKTAPPLRRCLAWLTCDGGSLKETDKR
jgi:anti-anti-sigma regulatory factor